MAELGKRMLAGIWGMLECGMLAGTVAWTVDLSADEHSEFDKGKAENSQVYSVCKWGLSEKLNEESWLSVINLFSKLYH